MNTKTICLFLALANLTGCVVAGTRALNGDVQFTWSFSGRTCAQVPQINSVQIIIPGEQLQNDGRYPCSTNNYPGIVLHDFYPGTYAFTVNALDYSGHVLYTATSSFTVDGSIRVTIDLTPAGGLSSYAYLMWTFPANSQSPNPNCAQAGVDFVDVQIDQNPSQRFNCAAGMSQPGATTAYLFPGTHQIILSAVSSSVSYPYYQLASTLTTTGGAPASNAYALQWAVGGVSIGWQLSDGSMAQTCAQAGITTLYVNFQDANGVNLYSGAGDAQPCIDAPILYDFFPPGNYRLFVQGTGRLGLYRSNFFSPPLLTIAAGQFANPSQTLVANVILGQ